MSGKVLVTGANGFVGSRLVDALRHRGIPMRALVRSVPRASLSDVEVVQCDLTRDTEVIAAAVEGCDVVFHCAGAVGDHVTWENGKAVNVEAVRSIAQAARHARVRRFVHVSSVAVYGFAAGTYSEGSPRRRVGEAYIDTKSEGEEVCEAVLSGGPTSLRIIRPAIIYGSGDTGMIPHLAELLRKRVPMIGSGANDVGLVHIDDVVDALIAAATHEGEGRVFNVMGPDDLTWAELVDLVVARFNLKPARWMPVPLARLLAWTMRFLAIERLGPNPPPLTPHVVQFLSAPRRYPTVALGDLGVVPHVLVRRGLRQALGMTTPSVPLVALDQGRYAEEGCSPRSTSDPSVNSWGSRNG